MHARRYAQRNAVRYYTADETDSVDAYRHTPRYQRQIVFFHYYSNLIIYLFIPSRLKTLSVVKLRVNARSQNIQFDTFDRGTRIS